MWYRLFLCRLQSDHDRAIVIAIINLSRSFGFHTVAEGVETEEQLAFLREQGCNEAQGYYFSKPLSVADFEAFLQKRHGKSPVVSGNEVC